MNLEQERQAFEAWFSTTESCKYLSEHGAHSPFYQAKEGVYINTRIEYLWQTWLARAKVSPWVSVEARLPKPETPVLIKTNAGIVEACLISENSSYGPTDGGDRCFVCYDDEFEVDITDVSHWMPIPTSPEHPI